MAKLLHILASPRVESYSTRVARAFLDSYRQACPDDRIEALNLFQADIPPFCAGGQGQVCREGRPNTP